MGPHCIEQVNEEEGEHDRDQGRIEGQVQVLQRRSDQMLRPNRYPNEGSRTLGDSGQHRQHGHADHANQDRSLEASRHHHGRGDQSDQGEGNGASLQLPHCHEGRITTDDHTRVFETDKSDKKSDPGCGRVLQRLRVRRR